MASVVSRTRDILDTTCIFVQMEKTLHLSYLCPISSTTPYSLNWEFVNSQNKVRNVLELNMSRVFGGKEWLMYKAKEEKSIKMVVLTNERL